MGKHPSQGLQDRITTEAIIIYEGDETTDLTAAANKRKFRMPYALTVTDVRASCSGAPTGDVKSTGTVTCATAVVDDTVTVNGLLYTAVAGARANDTQFSIDTGNDETALDLAAAITADTRTGTDVATIDQTAVSASAVVTITASIFGDAADAIGLSSSDGVTLAVSGANLAGGVNPLTVDINDGGTTILSTKLTVDASETTSTTALIPAVISDTALADDAEISVDIDDIGGTAAGKGLKVYVIGRRA